MPRNNSLIHFFLIFLSLTFSSCNYQLEGANPSLPEGSKTLAILPIQNRTFQGGLETKLKRALRRALRNNSSVNLVPIQDSELLLEIQLKTLERKQTSVAANGLTVALQLTLNGTVVLRNNKTKNIIWKEGALNAVGNLSFEKDDSNTGLTGSTIERGDNIITTAFAKRVFERLFFNF